MSKRRQRLQGEIGAFVRRYGRKKYPGHDPNDRELEQQMKQMDPRDLDELLHGDPDSAESLSS